MNKQKEIDSYRKKALNSLNNISELSGSLNNVLTECGLVDKYYSADTIRIAISTLKAFGCKIDRPCKSTKFKYRLSYHPFSLSYLNLIKKTCLKQVLNTLFLCTYP